MPMKRIELLFACLTQSPEIETLLAFIEISGRRIHVDLLGSSRPRTAQEQAAGFGDARGRCGIESGVPFDSGRSRVVQIILAGMLLFRMRGAGEENGQENCD